MGSATSRQREHLASLIEPVVAKFGYDLEDLSVNPAGRRSLVRVMVDGDEGVALDDVAEVSKAISATLDEHDGIMGRSPYVLEVTSPGVDRPLTLPRHWRRSVGRLVKIRDHDDAESVGRVVEAGESDAELDFDGTSRRVEYSKVRSARVQVEFSHSESSHTNKNDKKDSSKDNSHKRGDSGARKKGHSEGGRP